MNRCIRHAAAFCLLLLLALLANAVRVQVLRAGEFDANPANRRIAVARFADPRGDIFAAGRRITGSRPTGGQLRYARTYTDGPLYAPVTGFSSQVYGASLLEGTEDGVLSGTDGRLASQPLWHELTRARQRGGDVHTTIDPDAQRAAYAGLAGRRGAVAALDPATGRILALVSSPSYDPAALAGAGPQAAEAWQRLTSDPDQPMLDRAIRQTYPPGSTFKVVTAAAGLERGRITDLRAPTDSPDPYPLPGTSVRLGNESGGCADASVYDAFRISCNTVFAKLGADLGPGAVAAQAERFGFNDAGLRIPTRVAASTVDTAMSADRTALSSIGQFDTRATPLQMAMVAAAVANDGVVMKPYVVAEVFDADGQVVTATEPEELGVAMSPETADVLALMMESAVTSGTATRAAVPGVRIGGKTGTAQVPDRPPHSWFIGFGAVEAAPDEPQIAIAVLVESSEATGDDATGGTVAAPIAQQVLAEFFSQ
jgi:peptidoglycan glycosyltransferase